MISCSIQSEGEDPQMFPLDLMDFFVVPTLLNLF